jgi:hypothetical protein
LLRTLLMMFPIPFLIGLGLGLLHPSASEKNKKLYEGAIIGLANPDLFNILALVSVLLLSIYVVVKGPISPPHTRTQKAIVLWLPSGAIGTLVPFFYALASFLYGPPSSPSTMQIIIFAVVGFIWSVGFLILLVVPAHSTVPPRDPRTKKQLYAILLFSTLFSGAWFYGA